MYALPSNASLKSTKKNSFRKTALAMAIGAVIASHGTVAFAETYTVTDNGDSDAIGSGTLRAAIDLANANPGADEIIFAAGLSDIMIDSRLTISDSLTISGPGQDQLSIRNAVPTSKGNSSMLRFWGGTGNSENFEVSGLTLELTDTADASLIYIQDSDSDENRDTLTIRNSRLYQSHDESHDRDGLAIVSAFAQVNIESSTISAFVSSSYGAAIYSYSSDLTINNSTLSGNTSGQDGGAIYSYDNDITIDNSILSGNTSGGFGGAIYNYANDITINNSTLSGNTSGEDGGAIYNSSSRDLTINNSTLSGNTSGDQGGAIYNNSSSSDLTINNSTLSDNAAGSEGGAIYNYSSELTINNSIIAGNTAASAPNINGAVNLDHSLVGDDTGATITEISDADTNLIGTSDDPIDPLLGPLADNGGLRVGVNGDQPLLTHAVLDGSPVINAGDQSAADLPANDQRGLGFVRIRDGGLELGAVEHVNFSSSSSGGSFGFGMIGVLLGLLGLRRRPYKSK